MAKVQGKRRILILHGPNLNLLGSREVDVYGTTTLGEIDDQLRALAQSLGVDVECRQTNHEGELIDWIQQAHSSFDGIVLNPGALTHTSYALADAVRACGIPCVETHLSNIHARESYRHESKTAGACVGSVLGFGPQSYQLSVRALCHQLDKSGKSPP